jgi:hypothetical protein
VALAPHRDLTGTPIEVAEPQVGGSAPRNPNRANMIRIV